MKPALVSEGAEAGFIAQAPTAPPVSETDATRERPRRGLPNQSGEERKSKAIERALAQEEGRYRLRDLKRAHTREAKHYVNCPLDYDTKMRLQKAAFDNDIKMTVIIKAAVDQFLRDNGY
ncbi:MULTISPECIES: hypothetical protein [unclassified Mesorhizobium]|uniref:hypothetical protein n=1 Tax=unclassified Mesorhizobium TaxID=325217 RepID=UPI001FDEFEC1|nr:MULTISPECIES: hypothetical protein [unclassified Mesorhizobium]